MTLIYKTAMATVLIAAAAHPAMGQRMPVGGSSTNTKSDPNARVQETSETQGAQAGATSTTGRKLNISPKAQKALVELQNAVSANDVAAIPAKVQAALAVAESPDEKYFVGSNQARAAVAANDLAGLQAGLDLMASSGSGEPAILSGNYADLGRRFLAGGQAAAGAAALEKAIALDAGNGAALALMADIKNKSGDKTTAVSLMQRSFAASKAAGKKPAEGNYKFATNLAFEAKLPAANAIARDWVQAYPGPDSWRAAIQIYRSLNQPRGQQLVDMWRLARANNAVKGEADYDSYLSALIVEGNLAEAKSVLADAANQPNVDLKKNQFVAHNSKAGKAPARTAIDAQLKAATTGPAIMRAGDALYGIGAFAEAASAYRAALAKGADADLANLRLGMALARSGDKAGAQAALKAASGNQAAVAQYWLVYAGG
jgi:hypothetical protein